jgi:hypothetical protein
VSSVSELERSLTVLMCVASSRHACGPRIRPKQLVTSKHLVVPSVCPVCFGQGSNFRLNPSFWFFLALFPVQRYYAHGKALRLYMYESISYIDFTLDGSLTDVCVPVPATWSRPPTGVF